MTDEANNTNPATPVGEAPARGPAAFCDALRREFPAVLAGALSALLGRNVRAGSVRLDRTMSSAFLATLPDPETGVALLAAEGETGRPHVLWLEIPPRLAYAMIDILLGGEGKVFVPARPMSAAERSLLHKAAGAVAQALGQVWSAVTSGAALGATLAPTDAALPDAAHETPVVVLAVDLSLAGQQGVLRLCLPQALLPAAAPTGDTEATADASARGVIEITACLEMSVPAEDLRRLQPGDLLATDTPIAGDLTVRAGGIPKFLARLGSSAGKKAIVIKGALPPKKP